jgi:hypothetical protein
VNSLTLTGTKNRIARRIPRLCAGLRIRLFTADRTGGLNGKKDNSRLG